MNKQRPSHSVEIEIENLAEWVFEKNVNNAILEIELNGIENQHDLFCFCVDLLCKGLVLLYSNEQGMVEIEQITFDQFEHIKHKMSFAGIEANLNIVPYHRLPNTHAISMPADLNYSDIAQYSMDINTMHAKYVITFKMMRPCCN